ncbi:MAG: ABC transporter permease [Planctomycetes bacterium]|nr:ABC transporter permease [Planctomycetota bacterium]
MNVDQPPSNPPINRKTALITNIYKQPSFKLVLALGGIYFFFVIAIGIQKVIRVSRSNQQILAQLETEGVPEAQRLQSPQLENPWQRGLQASKLFMSGKKLELIARQTTIVGMAALGMTLVIISAGIDLSVGSIIALATVIVAWFLNLNGFNPLLAALIAIFICGLCGLISGILITQLRVVPFIVTLGMMLIIRGAAKGISKEQTIRTPNTWLNDLLASLSADQKWMLVPVGVWLLIIASIFVAVLLRYTRLGRHIFALGSNEQTARLCGVAVKQVKIIIYTLCGIFAGLAGVMQFSRLTIGDPTVAVGLELDVIAAVVIGGGSFAGGEGSILGSLVGALILTVIASGCSQMEISNWIQEIITGAIIIIAVALDRLRHRRQA